MVTDNRTSHDVRDTMMIRASAARSTAVADAAGRAATIEIMAIVALSRVIEGPIVPQIADLFALF
jgi:hypothetical protein